jgi:hypothetical protein
MEVEPEAAPAATSRAENRKRRREQAKENRKSKKQRLEGPEHGGVESKGAAAAAQQGSARSYVDLQSLSETSYYFADGLRHVRPYHFKYRTNVKERWSGRTLLEVYTTEFAAYSAEYYVSPVCLVSFSHVPLGRNRRSSLGASLCAANGCAAPSVLRLLAYSPLR